MLRQRKSIIIVPTERISPKELVHLSILVVKPKERGLTINRTKLTLVGCSVYTFITVISKPYSFIDRVPVICNIIVSNSHRVIFLKYALSTFSKATWWAR